MKDLSHTHIYFALSFVENFSHIATTQQCYIIVELGNNHSTTRVYVPLHFRQLHSNTTLSFVEKIFHTLRTHSNTTSLSCWVTSEMTVSNCSPLRNASFNVSLNVSFNLFKLVETLLEQHEFFSVTEIKTMCLAFWKVYRLHTRQLYLILPRYKDCESLAGFSADFKTLHCNGPVVQGLL